MNRSVEQIRQSWVLRHPCRTVEECGNLGYRVDLSLVGHPVATVLTIDLFTEPLAWHSDVAILGPDGIARPVVEWSDMDRAAAFDLARGMIAGVGCPDTDRAECDEIKIGIVRCLSAAEAAIVYEIAKRRPKSGLPAIGEINLYDFNDRHSEAGDGIYAPIERTVIHGRGH